MVHGLGVTRSVLPHLNYYTYLGVKFTCNGHWDAHLKYFVTSGKRKLNSLLRILCNPSLRLRYSVL